MAASCRSTTSSGTSVVPKKNQSPRETVMRILTKLLSATAIGICLVGAAPQAPVKFNAPEDVAAIKDIEERLATELDVDKVIEHYADDAIVLDIYAPGTFRGRQQIRSGFGPQLDQIKQIDATTPEMTVATNGNFACAAMQVSFDTTMKDGKKFKMNLRQLDAFKKIDGKWKIVQQHLGLPVDPETMDAIIDAPIKPREVVWSATPLHPPSTSPEQGRQEIRQFMDVGGESVGLDMLMSYYGPGDDILLYDSFHPQALIGRQEVRDFYAPMMNSYTDIKLSMPLFKADSDGSFGIQTDTQDISLTMKDGSKRKIALRQSDCMRRVNGKWYSFLEMISYPIDMKTNKAVMSVPETPAK
jgi:ketosteroid isomerase-like protein